MIETRKDLIVFLGSQGTAGLTSLLVLFAFGATAVGTSGAALAQGASEGRSQQLEEIVVTARKREENVQDVPISISAFSGDQLGFLGIEDLSEIDRVTPNLQFDSTAAVSGSTIASTVFIRGIGQTDFTLNSDPGVGIYLDGVYIARSVGGLLDLVDIESVEVLRGPQGTLFGKNTIGGAINIRSRRPAADQAGYVDFEFGNFDRRNIKAGVDAAISDTIVAGLSVGFMEQDGYQHRLLQPGTEDLGNVNRSVTKARSIWTPSDQFEIDLAFDHSRGREQSVPQSVLVIEPGTGAPFLPAAAGLIPGTTPQIRPGFEGQFVGDDLFSGLFVTNDPEITYYAGPSRSDFDIYGTSATVTFDIGELTVKSISAYRDVDSHFARDSLSSPFLVADTEDDYEQEQFSQELQVSGDLPSGNFVAGAFYLAEEGTNSNLVATSIGDLGSGGAVDNESVAVFAQANFNFTDRLGTTLGVRYTDETKRFSPGFKGGPQQFVTNANGLALGLPPTVPLILDGIYESSSDKTDVTLALDYNFAEELMVYGSYTTGFKAGGFSQRIGPGPGIPAPDFRPEEVSVYELGFKWLGLNQRLRLNVAAFTTDYEDVQITPIFEGIGPVTRNAGEAEINGLEVEWALVPNENWEFRGGIGLLETEYTSLTPESQVNLNVDGSPILTLSSELAKSPDVSAHAILARHWITEGGGTISAQADWSYTSEMYNDVLNAAELQRDDLHLIGGTLSYASPGENWLVMLRGVNLSNEEYIIAGNAERFAGNIGYTQGTYARPREYWISIRRSF
ncbi:MAG: TonB-dependent receptor [Woeseia sp.]